MIPKRLFMIWLGDNEPAYVKFAVDAYKKANLDFEVNLIRYTVSEIENSDKLNKCKYDDDIREVKKYVLQENPEKYSKIIKFFRSPDRKFIQRLGNALRYHLLFKYGGIYVDCDTFPVKPFDSELLNKESFCCFPWYMRLKHRWYDMFFMGCETGFYKDNTDFGDKVEVLLDDFQNKECWKRNHDLFFDCKLTVDDFNDYEKKYYIDHYIDRTWRRGVTPGCKYDNKNRKKVIAMASFPPRKDGMISSIKQLLPQCDDFYLWLNEYKSIPEELNQFDKNKLHIILSDVNLQENGRYTFIAQNKNAYFFICDDDIDWPPDYVQYTIDVMNECSENDVFTYYNDNSFLFEKEQLINKKGNIVKKFEDKNISILFGCGTLMFIPQNIGFYPTIDMLNKDFDVELIFGDHINKNNITVINPKRRDKFLQWKKINGTLIKNSSTALHCCGIKTQRYKNTLNYMKQKYEKVS